MWKQYMKDPLMPSQFSNSSTLNYSFYNENPDKVQEFSLLVEDSDWYAHENILNALVGNLVKFSANGKLEPYLAEKYLVSSDGLTWTYYLKDNLFCEDGTEINSKNFVEALHRQIKKYSKSTGPIDFENLIGFDDFIDSKSESIKGLSYYQNSIIFKFNKKPEDLNEMLRMPYFGFWCEKSFDSSYWNSNKQFVSSSGYKLESAESNKLILKKRTDWFANNQKTIEKIIFTYQNLDGFLNISGPKIIEAKNSADLSILIAHKHTEIMGPPTLVNNLILSPFKNGPCKDNNFRIELINRIRKNQHKTKYINTSFFYKFLKNEVESNVNNGDLSSYKNLTLNFGTLHPPSNDLLEFINFLNSLFLDLNIKFNLVYENMSFSEWRKKLNSNLNFDGRFGGVANGSRIQNFVLKMMFCTNLGVSYPDPSGRICDLVSKQDRIGGAITKEYIKEFNQILYDDASVIPLQNYNFVWYLSDEIDPTSFPPTAEHPLFEKIKLK